MWCFIAVMMQKVWYWGLVSCGLGMTNLVLFTALQVIGNFLIQKYKTALRVKGQRSKIIDICARNVITSMVHHNTHSHQRTSISDQFVCRQTPTERDWYSPVITQHRWHKDDDYCWCTDMQTHKHTATARNNAAE